MRLKVRYFVAILVAFAMPTTSLIAREPVRVIFDTDIEADVDDVGAVAVLHALADQGEAKILAMGVSVKYPWSAPCLDALNTYFGRPEIPIGVVKGAGVNQGSKYAEEIAKEFPHRLKSADDAPDVVALYRQTLAGQPDKSVVLITVGFLTNVANLLDSPADKTSELTGRELIERKIKSWVCMGGGFPKGREWNLWQDTASARKALADWPTPIVFSGFEIGQPIETGAGLKDLPATSPIRRSYELYNGLANRSSWDQTAVLYAVRGLDGRLKDVWDISAPGTIEMLADGSNRWQSSPSGKHTYLLRKVPNEQVAHLIEPLMLRLPREK
jgi:hypothetical protein